jgi:hypothetical protein
MNSKELQELQEAYSQVGHLDEAVKGESSERRRDLAAQRRAGYKPLSPSKGRYNVAKMQADIEYFDKKEIKNEEFGLYDVILSHLLDEGYASTEESADKIILSMSESWFEDIMELNRYAKETGKSLKTGRASVKGGNEQIKKRVEKEPYLKYGGSREKPKVRGEKPPKAGEPGSGVQDPAHKVSLRRTAKELNSQKRIGSRFD